MSGLSWLILAFLVYRVVVVLTNQNRASDQAKKSGASPPPLPSEFSEPSALKGKAHPWRDLFTPSELVQLSNIIGEHLQAMGVTQDPKRARFLAMTIDQTHPDNWLGLEMMARACRKRPPSLWEKVADFHFGELDQREKIMAVKDDFEQVKALIFPSLVPAELLEEDQDEAIGRIPIPGIGCILVFDTNMANFCVGPEDARQWDKSEEELIRLAFANLAAKYPPQIRRDEVDGMEYRIIADGSKFDASHALALHRLPELSGPGGVLVGLPSPQAMVAVPVLTDRIDDLKDRLARMVVINFQYYPSKLSQDLYWHHDGEWTRIEIDPAEYAPEAPPWAGGMDQEQLDRFLELISDHFREQVVPVVIDAAAGELAITQEKYQNARFHLANLAGLCLLEQPERWSEIIARHFSTSERTFDDQIAFFSEQKDFEKLKTKILPRLYGKEMEDQRLVTRPSLEDTVLALVFDLPDVVRILSRGDLEELGVSEDDLFKLAFRNLRAKYPPHFSDHEIEPGNSFKLLRDEHFFNSAYALMLESQEELVGPRGSIIGVPHRGALLVHPVVDATVLQVIPHLARAVTAMFQNGPGAISPHLYWYRDGNFQRQPFRFVDLKFEFNPTDEFALMLKEFDPGPTS